MVEMYTRLQTRLLSTLPPFLIPALRPKVALIFVSSMLRRYQEVRPS